MRVGDIGYGERRRCGLRRLRDLDELKTLRNDQSFARRFRPKLRQYAESIDRPSGSVENERVPLVVAIGLDAFCILPEFRPESPPEGTDRSAKFSAHRDRASGGDRSAAFHHSLCLRHASLHTQCKRPFRTVRR